MANFPAGWQDNIGQKWDAATANLMAALFAERYIKPSGGIPKTDLTAGVQTSLDKADTASQGGSGGYTKPPSGIPKSDLTAGVQTTLDKADTATQGGYTKSPSGIPKTDLTAGVQTSLDKADTATQGGYIKPSGGIPATDLTAGVQTTLATMGTGTGANLFANVLDHGADRTGVADSAAAFTAAYQTGKTVFVPSGTYTINSTPITTLAAYGNTVSIVGAGCTNTIIGFASTARMVNTTDIAAQVYVTGLWFNGGPGPFRFAYTGGTSGSTNKTITDCIFQNFTACAIAVYSSDTPYWKLVRLSFIGANEDTTMAICLCGWVDSVTIADCEIWSSRVGIKIQGTPNNLHVVGGFFARLDNTPTFPRVAIWVVPTPSWSAISGFGGTIQNFKFGNELYPNNNDYHILVADEGSGTNPDDKFPTVASVSTGWTNGWTVFNNLQMNAGTDIPLVYSTTPNLQGLTIGPNMQTGSSSPIMAPLLRLKTATGFDPTIQIVGPVASFFDPYHPPVALTQAESGTLTGQPPMLGQECNTRNVVSSATTLTLGVQSRINIFTGSTATWTLPRILDMAAPPWIDNRGAELVIKNRGSGNLTVSRAGTDQIYTTSAVTSYTIAAGASSRLVCDATYWVVL